MAKSTDYQVIVTDDKTVTIEVGETVSGVLDLHGTTLSGFVVPSNFSGTTITFQVSVDGTNYFGLYDNAGDAVSFTVAASTFVKCDVANFAGARLLKFVSGTTQATTDAVLQISSRAV